MLVAAEYVQSHAEIEGLCEQAGDDTLPVVNTIACFRRLLLSVLAPSYGKHTYKKHAQTSKDKRHRMTDFIFVCNTTQAVDTRQVVLSVHPSTRDGQHRCAPGLEHLAQTMPRSKGYAAQLLSAS
jgi:hypothetical protein